MRTRTDGRWHDLGHPLERHDSIRISTPGVSLEALVSIPNPDAGAIASEGSVAANDINVALKRGGYREHLDTRLTDVKSRRGVRAPVLQFGIPVRRDQIVIAVKVENGILQFHLPQNSLLTATSFRKGERRTRRKEKRVVYRRFAIPIYAVSRPSIRPGHFAFMGALPGDVIVRFFVRQVSKQLLRAGADIATDFVVRTFERLRKGKESLKYMSDVSRPMTNREIGRLEGETLLLFIHGILSSLDGGFAPYATKNSVVRLPLEEIYGRRNIVGWDHWTLGRTPYENAAALLKILPCDITVDIVCHSRGAAVARALAEHPYLREICEQRHIRFRRVISVAGAVQGSQLAEEENWEGFINSLSHLASLDGTPGILSFHGIVALLTLAVHGAFDLPGVAALCPGSDFYNTLNQSPYGPMEYWYARANYRADTPVKYLWEKLVNIAFGQSPHDLVVPYEGAALFNLDKRKGHTKARRLKNYGELRRAQAVVYHTNFFQQPDIYRGIIKACRGALPQAKMIQFMAAVSQPAAQTVTIVSNAAKKRFGNIKWN